MEPLAYMYTDHAGEMFIQPNRANMDKRFWTETPLYREPVDLVEALQRIAAARPTDPDSPSRVAKDALSRWSPPAS